MKRVKLHYSAFQSYRRNEGSKAAVSANPKGATALVHTENTAALIDNAVHNTLVKAMGGGG